MSRGRFQEKIVLLVSKFRITGRVWCFFPSKQLISVRSLVLRLWPVLIWFLQGFTEIGRPKHFCLFHSFPFFNFLLALIFLPSKSYQVLSYLSFYNLSFYLVSFYLLSCLVLPLLRTIHRFSYWPWLLLTIVFGIDLDFYLPSFLALTLTSTNHRFWYWPCFLHTIVFCMDLDLYSPSCLTLTLKYINCNCYSQLGQIACSHPKTH